MSFLKKIVIFLIKTYQNTFSKIGLGSCRYYPTCSEYAIWQFENNSLFKASLYSLLRVLKCNQFFKGGFDYPKIKKINLQPQNFQIKHSKKVKFWYVPQKSGYLVVKNIFKGR